MYFILVNVKCCSGVPGASCRERVAEQAGPSGIKESLECKENDENFQSLCWGASSGLRRYEHLCNYVFRLGSWCTYRRSHTARGATALSHKSLDKVTSSILSFSIMIPPTTFLNPILPNHPYLILAQCRRLHLGCTTSQLECS